MTKPPMQNLIDRKLREWANLAEENAALKLRIAELEAKPAAPAGLIETGPVTVNEYERSRQRELQRMAADATPSPIAQSSAGNDRPFAWHGAYTTIDHHLADFMCATEDRLGSGCDELALAQAIVREFIVRHPSQGGDLAQAAPDPVMEQQMLEDFSDPDFERSLAQIRDVDRHMRTIRGLTAALKAAREYIATNHDLPTAVEAGRLLYAIDAALSPVSSTESKS